MGSGSGVRCVRARARTSNQGGSRRRCANPSRAPARAQMKKNAVCWNVLECFVLPAGTFMSDAGFGGATTDFALLIEPRGWEERNLSSALPSTTRAAKRVANVGVGQTGYFHVLKDIISSPRHIGGSCNIPFDSIPELYRPRAHTHNTWAAPYSPSRDARSETLRAAKRACDHTRAGATSGARSDPRRRLHRDDGASHL